MALVISQRLMDNILHGLPGVICYIDDILITGKDGCAKQIRRARYLGHEINQEGIHAVPCKVEAINNAPPLTNVLEHRSFLGLLNYYVKFIQNFSSFLHSLNGLLHANQN